MIYLILACCSSALISIIMRSGEDRIQNNISTLAVNYLICLLLSFVYSIGSGSITIPADSGRIVIILGLISGLFYVGSFILYQFNIYRNGVLMSSAFMKLGVLVPTTIAVAVFGEHPGILQIFGIILTLSAILIVNGIGGRGAGTDISAGIAEKGRSDRSAGASEGHGASSGASFSEDNIGEGNSASATVTAPKSLILLLLVGGSGDAMSKIYEELGPMEYSSQYLLYTFAAALIICTLTAAVRGQKLALTDIIYGALVGIPNYYSARFLLLSLSSVPAVIAYPVFSVGTIFLVGAAGVLIFHEKMTKRQWIAVAIIIAAMILLNAQG